MFAPELINEFGWEDARGESASKDGVELTIQSADAHFVKVPIGIDDGLMLGLSFGLAAEVDHRAFGFLEYYARVGQKQTAVGFLRFHLRDIIREQETRS